MKTKFFLALLGLVLCLAPQLALADTTWNYDGNAPGGHGFYNGSGNFDGHFTTSTTNYSDGTSISLSLRGAQRFVGPIAPVNIGEYLCSAGMACSYEFSVWTTVPTGIGSYKYNLIINDLTTGKTLNYDPSGGDDSYWNGGKTATYSAGAQGFQNSEWFGFNFLATPLGYHATDEVLVTLMANPDARTLNSDPLPAVTIGFNTAPTPEPSSVVLTLTVIGFAGFKLRRRRQQA